MGTHEDTRTHTDTYGHTRTQTDTHGHQLAHGHTRAHTDTHGLTRTHRDTHIGNVSVLPIVLYGAETWTMRKHERSKIDSFELWCWRRVLRVSWMERKTNILIIENIKPEWTLESRVPKAALSYFGPW